MWPLEFVLLIAAWELVQPLGNQVLMAVLPYIAANGRWPLYS
jgi:hypothetical protein